MKKLISVLLTVAMLLGSFVMTSVAANDTCIRLVDTNGSSAYSAGSSAVNSYVVANDGATLIFDVKIEATATPSAGLLSQILAFSGSSDYNNASYNFSEKKFTVSEGTKWPTENQTTNYRLAARDFELYKGVWYELAFQFNGNEVVIYVDGAPMVAAELDIVNHEYLLLYPQFCTILIDNLRVCDKNYNVRDRVGTVKYTTDFTGITSVSGCSSVWDFSGTGYSVSQNGRPMPGFSDMVPNRVVEPAAKGNYLQYKESAGSGVAQLSGDFSDYKGFVYVEDVRIDRKSVGANFAVRFGSNYIAGYDWDSQSFRIATRSGYGFSTAAAYSFAVAEYALELGTFYEFAVRQTGSLVAIYIDGVMVVSAVNDSFNAGFNTIQVSHYRVGATIDNVIIAYPDYDIKEAAGKTLHSITFDESAEYLNSVLGLNLGASGYGYSIAKGTTQPKIVVDSVEATESLAEVGISIENGLGYDAFELSVSYDSALSVAKANAVTVTGGQSVLSPVTSKPLKLSFVTAGDPVVNAKVLNVTFNAPGASGDYTVTATLTPYKNGVPMANVTGTGTVTVPKGSVAVGLPGGITYDGEMLYWDALDDATYYGIYVIHEDGYEELIDEPEDAEYELIFEDFFGDPGVYKIRIVAYNEYYEPYSMSNLHTIIYTEDEVLYCSLSEYADMLYGQLEELVADRVYNEDNQDTVNSYLEEASYVFSTAKDLSELERYYDDYYTVLDEIPENELVIGKPDGISYNGQALKWNSYSGTDHYDVYVSINGKAATKLASVYSTEYAFNFAEKFSDAGEYEFAVYACNESGDVLAQSNTYTVIYDSEGTVHEGLSAYAKTLGDKLDRLVSDRLYSVADQERVNTALANAKTEIAAATSYSAMTSKYNTSYTALDAIPVMQIIDGKPDGIVYADDTLTWEAVADAVRYEIYIVAEDGSETYIGESAEASYVLPYEDNFGDESQCGVKIYAYNTYDKLFAVSDVYTVETETVVLGDANGDGIADMSDVAYLARAIAGASLVIYPGADMDGDGEYNVTDLGALRRINA